MRPSKLLNKNFVLLWNGQLVSQIGTQVSSIAVMLWILEATGSSSLMGLIMVATTLPAVLLGPLAGAVIDRLSRRAILVVCDMASGLAALGLAAVATFRSEDQDLVLVWMIFASTVGGIAIAFLRPAVAAALPDLVPPEKLTVANGMNQSGIQVAIALGQAAGGILFEAVGAAVLFAINGASYLFSAVTECFLQIPRVHRESPATTGARQLLAQFWGETMEGVRYVWERPGMRTLFLASAGLNLVIFPFIVLLPIHVTEHLQADPRWYGFISGAFGFGSLVGYGAAGSLGLEGRRRERFMVASLLLASVLFLAFGLLLSPWAALTLFLVIGILLGIFNINVFTLLQITTPNELRGRVFGLLMTLSTGLVPLSSAVAGVVGDLLDHNTPLIFQVCAVALVAQSVRLAFHGGYRSFLAQED